MGRARAVGVIDRVAETAGVAAAWRPVCVMGAVLADPLNGAVAVAFEEQV